MSHKDWPVPFFGEAQCCYEFAQLTGDPCYDRAYTINLHCDWEEGDSYEAVLTFMTSGGG